VQSKKIFTFSKIVFVLVIFDLFGLAAQTMPVQSFRQEAAKAGESDLQGVPAGLVAEEWGQITRAITLDFEQQAYLKASNAQDGDWFGFSVAISGDTLVVGAMFEDSSAGAAYVFTRSGTAWTQQDYLKASTSGASDYFGWAVAISGDTLVVGAHQEDSSATDAGAAYVFTRSGSTWTQQGNALKASNAGAGDKFGFSVAISGDTIAVGAPFEDSSDGSNEADNNATEAGAAYVFTRSGTAWTQQDYLKASTPGASDYFGFSVAISGDTLVVGAPYEDSSAGAAYVYVPNGSGWDQEAYLKASSPGAGNYFGESVAISGDTVVVGAYGEDSSAGAAYVFVPNGSGWDQERLTAANAEVDDYFGESVAISGDTVVVGASYEDSGVGAAYVFVRSESTWAQQGEGLTASNAGADDYFGDSVAISGDTLVVGAWGKDSIVGAAYVFEKEIFYYIFPFFTR
jgi:trimeric autotransporter adhesin